MKAADTALATAPSTPANAEIIVAPLAVTAGGKAVPSHANACLVLEGLPGSIRFEQFSQRIVCEGLSGIGHLPDGEWTDTHTTAVVALCESQDLNVSPATVDRAVALHAQKHAYNVLTDFADDCAGKWDGVRRVDRAFTTYWGADDTPAARAAARVFFLGMMRRALDPGAKVDTCLLMYGAQGLLKSTSLATLAGDAWFSDSPLPIGDKDGMQNLPGTLIWEIGENVSISKRDAETAKAYLSQRLDDFRPSYGRHKVKVPRQTVFAITTNKPHTLRDETGERRFLPFTARAIRIEALERDRIQLLGEAAARVLEGEQHWPTSEEGEALDGVRADHAELDPWQEPIAAWLAKHPQPLEIGAIFQRELYADQSKVLGPIPMPVDEVGKREQGRAAAVLHRLGWERRRAWTGPDRGKWLWHPPGRG